LCPQNLIIVGFIVGLIVLLALLILMLIVFGELRRKILGVSSLLDVVWIRCAGYTQELIRVLARRMMGL
jgi:hypothetical protein